MLTDSEYEVYNINTKLEQLPIWFKLQSWEYMINIVY